MENTLPPVGRRPARRAYARAFVAWVAVALTLAVAVLGALEGGSNGLALGVSSLAAAASETLQAWGARVQLGYAFVVGMAAAVNPCGVALLPTYLGLYLSGAADERRGYAAQVRRAVLVSLTMTSSFVILFGAAGLLVGLAGAVAGDLLPWLSISVGVLLVLAGGRLLAGASLAAARRVTGPMALASPATSLRRRTTISCR